ncbi:beige/beach-related [Anaeramoeba ignava]|uniref:Beige/beach-related n=1 Tax=Anaeramoeba ignava TaxID=1746090 RepID=A0A9Q0RGC0_ANAIG|nr:beige/beach-related [Anaeramoeba ignava]
MWEDPIIPKFHYGAHYSSAAIVLYYLVRLEPFTTQFVHLQGGKFDHAERLFHSIQKTFLSASKVTMSDVKELILEFSIFLNF